MNERLAQMHLVRAKQFFERIERDFFAEELPLEVGFCLSPAPLPYEKSFADLDFQPIHEGVYWGKQWDSGYFRLSGTIPQSWDGKAVWLHLAMGGEITLFDDHFVPYYGMTNTCIQIPNFRKVHYPLTACAKAGEKFTVYAEVAGNGYNDTGKGDCDIGFLEHLKFGLFRPEVWQLKNDFKVVFSLLMSSRGGDDHVPGGFQANKKPFSRFGLRSAQLCRNLAEAVDAYADDPANAPNARAVLKKELDRPAQSSQLTTTAVGHAHLDIGYLWTLQETKRKACRTFANQLHNINRYPGYVFGASQPQLYAFVKERSPQLYEKVKAAYKQGAWDLQGGMWVEADTNMTSGESMVRQFLHGKNFYKEEFGADVKNLWLPDVFGYTASLPQIMKLAGVDYFMTQKISWNEFNPFPHHSFVWRGLSGAEVIAHFPACDGYNSYLEPEEMHWAEDNYNENDVCPEFLTLFGAGDGGGGPLPEHIETGKRLRDLEDCPHVKFGRAADFFDRLGAIKKDLPVWDGELYFELHRATLTDRAQSKWLNRKIEQALAATETLLSLLPGSEYPAEEMDKIWKYVLMSQFHDLLPGSSIDRTHREVEGQLAQYLVRLQELAQGAAEKLLQKEAAALTLFNTLVVPYTRLVQLPPDWAEYEVLLNGRPLARQQDERGTFIAVAIPALGSVTLTRGAKAAVPAMTAGELVLENDFARYEFNTDGNLLRAYDKTLDREFIRPGDRGNLFLLRVNQPRVFEAWEIERADRDVPAKEAVSIEPPVAKKGGLFSSIDFVLKVGNTTIREKVVLENHTPRLDCSGVVDWNEKQRMLRLLFPADVDTTEAVCEMQHGCIRRATHENTSWDMARFEFAHHRYVDRTDTAGGAALLNDCKYGVGIHDGCFDLNLQMAASGYPDETCDRGSHPFAVSYFPHAAGSPLPEMVGEAAQLNRAPLALAGVTNAKLQLPFELLSGIISVEAFKQAERSLDRILRLNEPFGRVTTLQIRFAPGIQVLACDLLEWEEGTPLDQAADGTVTLTFRPFEVKTLRLKKI